MNRDNIIALLHVVTGLGAILTGLFARNETLLPREIARPLGLAIFLTGMLVFAWSLVYLRGAFLGKVEPMSGRLITNGPYRFVRHPVYLGMIILAVGLNIALRTLWGIGGVLLFFIPTTVYRARLEENALSRRYGEEWDEYVKQTPFIFPLIRL